jgi:hypothetical protein
MFGLSLMMSDFNVAFVGKSLWRMNHKRGQWILGYCMELLMVIHGLVNGVTAFAVGALVWKNTIITGQLRF